MIFHASGFQNKGACPCISISADAVGAIAFIFAILLENNHYCL